MSAQREATVWIGGEAGEGIASAGDVYIKAAARQGFGAFAHNSFQSAIRGGEVLLQIRIGPHPVRSQGGHWDFLIALNQNILDHRLPSARTGGCALYNAETTKPPHSDSASMFGLPVGELSADIPWNPVMQNMVLLGALAFLQQFSWPVLEGSIRDQFDRRKAPLADPNVTAARRGWEYALRHFAPPAQLSLSGDRTRRIVITGNQAVGLGALAAGCKLFASYPMTPASSIMHWLALRAPRYGMLVHQAEDELAAINTAVGAGYAGARAMVATSGGGFSLMTEGIGLAGMIEAPVVAVLSQRAGPSTGLATKTEQSDLFQALGASQGEYPKAVLAALDPVDAYYSTIEAHNLAEKYQMPVILLLDLYLSEYRVAVDPESLSPDVPIERGDVVRDVESDYLRYRDTPSGVSPRTLPGTPGGEYIAPSNEHNEGGRQISGWYTNPSMRTRMMKKRMRKMEGVRRDTADRAIAFEGPADAELTIVGWGSTFSILEEARQTLEQEGREVNLIQFRTLWPFPAERALPLLQNSKRMVCVENNYGGELARLIRQETGVSIPHAVRKFDGEPFSIEPLLGALRASLRLDAPDVQILVSSELDLAVRPK